MTKSPTRNCVVCGNENNHGNHFDVQCCRACAVFFRRRAGTKYIHLKCQSIHCGENRLCKPCRLKRCYSVGMNSNKFQHNRDPLRTSAFQELPRSFASFIGRPSLVVFCIPEDSHEKTFVDLKALMEKASDTLFYGPETPYIGPSQLKKLAMASSCSIPTGKVYKTITCGDMSYFWEYYVLRTAKWLTYFEEFQNIPHDMKLQLLSSFWHVFGRLDKMVTTANARRQKIILDDKKWAMSNGLVLDLKQTKVDLTAITKYPLEHVLYFLNSITVFDLTPQVDKLVDLDITDIEFNFMLAQLTFSYAAKRFQGDIMRICDRFQEVLSNDLHDYYVKERKMPRYSVRLSQLMQINNAIQNDIWKNRPRGELAALFNVFTVKFSHPDMFIDTGLV